jgi:hypothetical protein
MSVLSKDNGNVPDPTRPDQLNNREVFKERRVPFFSVALPAHSGPWTLIQFRNHFSQTV